MFPKEGKSFHSGRPASYAEVVAHALRYEPGGGRLAAKTIMRWTNASDRTVKNWLSGARGPSGEHLVALMGHSDAVLEAVLEMTGRQFLLNAALIHSALMELKQLETLLRIALKEEETNGNSVRKAH